MSGESVVRGICTNLTTSLIDLRVFARQKAETILTTITPLLQQFGNRKKLETEDSSPYTLEKTHNTGAVVAAVTTLEFDGLI